MMPTQRRSAARKVELISWVLLAFGIVVIFLSIWKGGEGATTGIIVGATMAILGVLFTVMGDRLLKLCLNAGGFGFDLEFTEERYIGSGQEIAQGVQQKTLNKEVLNERMHYAETKALPGRSTTDYTAIELAKMNKLLTRPSAHPTTPMYILDINYRILDWNEAFSLAFDRTMEGRQGRSVLEWTYHLDNYQQVLDHGEKIFANPDNLPRVDAEDIVYTSLRYKTIHAVKRAYQIPDDDGHCLAWLITMDLDFDDPEQKARYRYELLRLIGIDQLWSEYAISYDRVLTNTKVYNELIDAILGITGSMGEIDSDAKVLDIGAGTGNVSRRLMDGAHNRTVFALENNRIMIEFLRDKCARFLREDDQKPGILAIKQDVTSLYGLADNYFDCVVANNVFYALADPKECLQEILRVLKPGGELRMSGPRSDTDLNILFGRIRTDLQETGDFAKYRMDYEHVEQINKLRLKTMLYRWSTEQFCDILKNIGFKDIRPSNDVYEGQSMMVVCRKPDLESSGVFLQKSLKHV